ncbi:hypothetical protein ACOZ38_21745 [Sphaerisporangium viridialbum]|uniref:hypothetical protein n=1 Tax=Sphaerisporangium viridialbum TaxID=46189 RepID=UPI003C74EE0C
MVAAHMTAREEADPRVAAADLLAQAVPTARVRGRDRAALRPGTWRSQEVELDPRLP